MMKLTSTLRCPRCGFSTEEVMPTDACQFFYRCTNCDALLRPQGQDCCVFCSYGDTKCPPMQQDSSSA
jgi:hypothetical protein